MASSNDNLIRFYEKVYEEKNLFAEKAWETIKLNITLQSSLISITLGTLALLHTSEIFFRIETIPRILLIGFLFVLPILMILIGNASSKNFKRECHRLYEQRAMMIKLEEDLGVRYRKHINQFSEEETYLPKELLKEQYKFTKDFVKEMLKSERLSIKNRIENFFIEMKKEIFYKNMEEEERFGRMYSNLNSFFTIFNSISILLFIIIILTIILHISFPFLLHQTANQ